MADFNQFIEAIENDVSQLKECGRCYLTTQLPPYMRDRVPHLPTVVMSAKLKLQSEYISVLYYGLYLAICL